MKRLVCLLTLMTTSMGSCLALDLEASIPSREYYKALPQEILQEIIAISPIEIRAVNKTFYFLSSGYKAPGLMGVENPPQEKSDSFAGNPQWSKTFDFKVHDINAVPSVVWYRLIKKVLHLPLKFVPYLNNTQIHTVHIWDDNAGTIKTAILDQPNIKVHDTNIVDLHIREKSILKNAISLIGETYEIIPNRDLLTLYREAAILRQNSWRYQTALKIKAFFRETMRIILSCCSKAPNHKLFEDEFDDQG